ncbi:hypothetical protein M422DRAFT_256426 [Sphaerobolus stellatus SS14]|uniref:Uncharacterized protein n=1 Tax=Sphaerobolus stellatus (strain SS14) TaxID=990650 RepID=A0A0C9VRV3_SPHS4|nr:hypothetical protein M422DRAFT_256426 [Sphaerobolus stellatus SS14]
MNSPTPVDHYLDGVDPKAPIRLAYPKDFYPNPHTILFPLDKTTYRLLGPEEGTKLCSITSVQDVTDFSS